MSKPIGVLVEEATIRSHKHFDSVPYANMRLVDVARILDSETAKSTINGPVIAKLLDRLMTALTHTLLAMEGRPESNRLSGLINRGLNRLLSRIPEITVESYERAFVAAHTMHLRKVQRLCEDARGTHDWSAEFEQGPKFTGKPSAALLAYLKQRDAALKKHASREARALQRGLVDVDLAAYLRSKGLTWGVKSSKKPS